MFALKLRPLYKMCDRVIIRNLRNSRLGVTGPNPGLNKRITAFKQEGLKIEDEDAEEFIEQSESNIYNIGEAYNEHMNETLIGKYEVRHRIIKEKYFKENMPNLLTWSEKEQIRHLATTQPDEWTPERIAESFPATVPVVKKLLKYPWKPATEQRIMRHDASVMRNWRELKEGSLSIPEEIRQHFLKFSDRVIPPLNKKSIKIDITPENKMGEFERIIQRCAAKERIKENSSHENKDKYKNNVNDQESENHREPSTKRDYNRVTLDELTARIQKRLDKGKSVDMPDKIILNTVNTSVTNTNESNEDFNKEIELYDNKSDENKITAYQEKENNNTSDIMNYPERIRIPKKAYKKGATYKVNDCFYDHDGKFLYRVLGMS